MTDRQRSPLAGATLAIVLMLHVVTLAQDVTEPSLKAAFIYNFAKFTDWPAALPPGEPFVICVFGDAAVGDALKRAVFGRLHADRPIVVAQVDAGTPKRGCRILYMSSMPVAQAGQLVAELRDAPVLTISDIEGFPDVGGITQFYFAHGQLRFRIRLESAKRARLQISSKLLVIARRNE
jgi:hypothetical protein